MAKLKQSVIIVFLGLYFLVKLNPDYVKAQCWPSAATVHPGRSVKSKTSDNNLLKVDRCISDNEPIKAVPTIKFSGIIFGLDFFENMISRQKEPQCTDSAFRVYDTGNRIFPYCLRI